MHRPISRRVVLTGVLSGAAVMCVAAGATTILALDDRDMLRAWLREMIGPYRMSEAEFEKFRQGVKDRYGLPNRMVSSAVAAAETTGAASLVYLVADSAATRYDRLKRNVLTEFLTKTDYLSGGEEAELSYIGNQPCSSPFARFDFT